MASASTIRKHSASLETLEPSVSIAEAKSHFSEVLATVEHRRQPITILRRGRPVAQIIPMQHQVRSLYGSMSGTLVEAGDIIGPTGGEWSVAGE